MDKRNLWEGMKLARRQLIELGKEPRLYIILMFVFFFLKREYDMEVMAVKAYELRPNFWELWPQASCIYNKMVIIWIGFLILVSDLPRQGDLLISYLLRTRKWVFALAQKLYIAGVSIGYFLFLQISQIQYFEDGIGWINKWTNYSKRILPEQFGTLERISYECLPTERFWLSAGLSLLVLMIVGMLILVFNMYGYRILGYLSVGSLIALDILLQVVKVPVLHYVSPLTLARLDAVDLGYSNQFPDIGYALAVLSLIYGGLSVVLYRKLKRYDF